MKNIGVHINHCCRKCGCKYGDIDCPVALGQVEAAYDCDDCFTREVDAILVLVEQFGFEEEFVFHWLKTAGVSEAKINKFKQTLMECKQAESLFKSTF